MPSVAVIPIRSFQLGKGRLADYLDPKARAELGRQLARKTATAAEEAGLLPVVVTSDIDVVSWGMTLGLPSVPDPGQGLSAAAAAGVEWAVSATAEWVILHSDLPLVAAADLMPLREAIEQGAWVIAPSSDGGTTAIGGRERMEFAYGPGSFARHLGRIRSARIFARAGLLLDIDTPSDLLAASGHRRGRWLREFLP